MERKPYPSDLTDEEWEIVRAAVPKAKGGRTGRPEKYPRREIWNAICYQARTGCQSRYLPHNVPPWGAGGVLFFPWRDGGLITAVPDALRTRVREQDGREPTPSAAIIDSQ